jgi:peptidoglycan hydrolase CwlO-like protein
MRKKFLPIVILTVLLITGFFFMSPQKAYPDELDDINRQLAELTDALNKSVQATKPLESQLTGMKQQIERIKGQLAGIDADIIVKRKEIDDGYKSLSSKQEVLANSIREYYIQTYNDSPLVTLLQSTSASDMTLTLAYQRAKTNQDKTIIMNIALSLAELEEKEKKLKAEQAQLVALRKDLDAQSAKLDEVVSKAKDYQKEVSGKIAALSQKQQEIVNAKSGSFTATIGDSDLADDFNASIKGFREAAPAGSFAMFSFGAHTHRKGMSQYGAFGRAKAGQSYKDILQKYYGKQPVGKDTGGTIKVQGQGEMDFEGRYLLGIAEMPSSWHPEALKAQAVAARTYAYRYKAEGKEICTTEACQVFNASKADNSPEAWKAAVAATRGEVIEDVVTYYSSTAGGWSTTSGWDTTDGSGGSSFADKAYEKLAGSPWFYKAWYTKGYSTSSDKCGRTSPWLNSTEMADIINAYYVMYGSGSGGDTGRVTPVTTSCWGGNPYSMDDLRSVSEGYGGGISSVSGVETYLGDGSTSEVVFQTNKGEKRLNGLNFKTAFNLRAPGYLSIPQSGFAFFKVEKK